MKHYHITLFLGALLSIVYSASSLAQSAPIAFSEAAATGFIDRYPDPDAIHWRGSSNSFTWQSGYIMFSMENLWRQTNDPAYYNYVKRFVDQHVDKDGNLSGYTNGALDNFLPGYACLLIYEQTGEDRYRKAAETVRRGFDSYPRTRLDMFLHSQKTDQVWVDGVFMGQIFLARYAKTLGHEEDIEEVIRQIHGIFQLCGREDGLLYHGWADKGKASWSREEAGHSPEVWSEGMGWIAVLLADVIDYLPKDSAGYQEVKGYIVNMCKGLKGVQDPRTGLWCQVVDKPFADGNWNETSGSGMFTYLIQKAIDKGYVPSAEYQGVVDSAYKGLLTKAVRNADGFINLIDCSSIGIKGSYSAYISQTREISTFAAYGSFILGTGIVEHRIAHALPQAFYACDYSGGKVVKIERGNVVWQHDAPLTNDLWVLDNGNLLFTTGTGVLELNPQGETVFQYKADCHVFACQRLTNGNTFVGECENGRLMILGPKGNVVSATKILPNGIKKAEMSFMRNARYLEDSGHFLVAHYGQGKVTEYDRKGKVVWEVATPGGAHSVIRLPDGNTLVAIADATRNPRIVEFDKDKNVVWQLSNDDLAGRPLRFMSGMQYIEGKGLFLTNWQGHRPEVTEPDLLWVTRDKRIVATLNPMPGITTLSSVCIR